MPQQQMFQKHSKIIVLEYGKEVFRLMKKYVKPEMEVNIFEVEEITASAVSAEDFACQCE